MAIDEDEAKLAPLREKATSISAAMVGGPKRGGGGGKVIKI